MSRVNIEKLNLKFPEAPAKLFNDLNIYIEAGEKVLLLGPSGSGKSTLLNVMGGLIPNVIHTPMKAEILDIPDDNAYVFQDPDSQFTMPTVAEELAFILENRSIPKENMEPMMLDALKQTRLDVPLDLNINNLSGGMKQKLSIASALLQNPDTLFLDEPTSMLDDESAASLWNVIEQIWEKRTVVIVEHRVDYIWDKVDRVILMNGEAQIIHEGIPNDVLRHHKDLLNEYGVWHPESWQKAPVYAPLSPQDEVLLKLKDLHLERRGMEILHVDHLSVGKGEWITLEGKNGTGKSSLLLAIMKLIPADGSIYYRGKIIKKTKHIAGNVYPVFQNSELQFITHKVFDEIFINMESRFDYNEAVRQTEVILNQFGLNNIAHLHPLEISTGQKRRLSVATALGGVPDVLLLDEPTFGLDQKSAFRMLGMFHEMAVAGTTIIMITHDENIKERYPSRRLIIENGTLHEKRTGHA
ncbi:ABC transporter ATP-binding protein [Jeotgalicoccus psychrophilus]|uniref:ABC transporter ATP-binding protein n=1 Tax=Jeotgalicoccus psychrophilus TaxID=157228 RepID=UPI0004052CF2|nr:ABC transporter ATP-binding protein [Jeotgalicoccus psychrophilus]